MDNPEGDVLFVSSVSSTKVSCLMKDFFVWDEVACPPKDSDTSTSAPLPTSEPTVYSVSGKTDESGIAPPRGFLCWILMKMVVFLSDFCRKHCSYIFPRGNFL